MLEFKAPNPWPKDKLSVFLAGSIEQGKAFNWQAETVKRLAAFDITIVNPRRDEWDASWEQSIRNPKFAEQVNWELDSLSDVDLIMMYFDPETLSPITLLELGKYSDSGKIFVGCPQGYWRRGNVEVECARAGIRLYESFEELFDAVKLRIASTIGHPYLPFQDESSEVTAEIAEKFEATLQANKSFYDKLLNGR